MIRGLYTSTMGMLKDEKRLEVASNNLANINTNGYKKDISVSKSFAEVMTSVTNSDDDNNSNNKIGKMALGVGIGEVSTNFSQGNIIKTDNSLDLAIMNSELGFFSVEVPSNDGIKEMYTRDGAFTINSKGELTTKDGYIVKGENGPIILNGSNVTVNSDGSIVENGQVVDKLLIKEFKDTKFLVKRGDNLLENTGEEEPDTFSGQVQQGAVESSNVNSISEMVEIINIMRSYEANQKIVKAQDDMLQKAVNEVGRV